MATRRALLLIADIGGYTEYMRSHRMSLAHAEVNTARLLEKVIDAAPGFDLIEIEGDAAFLSRRADTLEGDATVAATTRAAVGMHRAFHVERQYVASNLCPCDGCVQAHNLKLQTAYNRVMVRHAFAVCTTWLSPALHTRHTSQPRASILALPGTLSRLVPHPFGSGCTR